MHITRNTQADGLSGILALNTLMACTHSTRYFKFSRLRTNTSLGYSYTVRKRHHLQTGPKICAIHVQCREGSKTFCAFAQCKRTFYIHINTPAREESSALFFFLIFTINSLTFYHNLPHKCKFQRMNSRTSLVRSTNGSVSLTVIEMWPPKRLGINTH